MRRILIIFLSLFLPVCILPPTTAFAGWLVWQSPPMTPPPETETVKTVDEILKLLPENAVKSAGPVSKPVNMLFLADQRKIREIMEKAGWAEPALSMLEFIGGALMNISSGKKPEKFPPVPKLYVNGKPQDMSFTVRNSSGGTGVIRLWRLPYSVSTTQRPRRIPGWCAAMNNEKGLAPFKSAVEKVLDSKGPKVYFMPGRPRPIRAGSPRDSVKQKILVLEIND